MLIDEYDLRSFVFVSGSVGRGGQFETGYRTSDRLSRYWMSRWGLDGGHPVSFGLG
jgi:hypothetical protein